MLTALMTLETTQDSLVADGFRWLILESRQCRNWSQMSHHSCAHSPFSVDSLCRLSSLLHHSHHHLLMLPFSKPFFNANNSSGLSEPLRHAATLSLAALIEHFLSFQLQWNCFDLLPPLFQ